MRKQWIYKQNNSERVNEIAEKYNISPLVASVLQNRISEIGNCLDSDFNSLINKIHSPFLLNDMEEAVVEIESAVYNGDRITIYGDYDADGVTATAILYLYLESIGADVDYYIPDRFEDGYGVNENALKMLCERGTKLIITVDTGISAYEQIKYAYELGMQVIVTDHHECPEQLPECCAIINPKRKDSTYPFKDIAGVGVAFKLVCALNDGVYDIAESFVDLVCIGTVADVMPLIDENRAFVQMGLKKLALSDNVGINALLEKVGYSDKPINSSVVGFALSPRINACGRLYNASKAVDMLITDDEENAASIAQWLCDVNTQRQGLETKIYNEVIEIIEQNQLYRERVIVVANSGWHHGVIGIVASKITEKYYRPTILLTVDGDIAKGSSRSIEGFDIYEGLTAVSDNLEKFGGHSLAAGLTLKTDKIVSFRQAINQYAAQVTKREDYIPKIYVDSVAKAEWLNEADVEQLSLLEPFGNGNNTPIFAFNNAVIENIGVMSDNKHLRLRIGIGGASVSAVGFGMGNYFSYLRIGETIDVCGNLGINEYNNNRSVQLILRDIKKVSKEE